MRYLTIVLITLLISTKVHAQSDWHEEQDQWYYEQQQQKEKEAREKWQQPLQLPPVYSPDPTSLFLLQPEPIIKIEVNVNSGQDNDYIGQWQHESKLQQAQWNNSFQNGIELGMRATETNNQRQFEQNDVNYETQRSSNSVAEHPIKSYWQNLPSEPKPIDPVAEQRVIDSVMNGLLAKPKLLTIDPVADQRTIDSLMVEAEAVTASRKDILTGFLGIPWGTSQENVKRAILSRRDNARLVGQNHDSVWYYRGKFGDFLYSRMSLRFVDNKLYEGEVDFEIPYYRDTANDSSLTIFETIRNEITNKHGIPTNDNPVRLGINESPSSTWWWPQPDSGYSGNRICLDCSRDIKIAWHSPDGKTPSTVNVSYTCGKLEDQFYDQLESKRKARPQAKDY